MFSSSAQDWSRTDPKFLPFMEQTRKSVLEAYVARPELLREHYNLEESIRTGAYAHKQINELVQNAADPMEGLEGRIKVLLTPEYLYCANEGMPFNTRNIQALLMAYSSSKTGNEIGRFGLGFKSVLALTDSPQVFTYTGSFSFDKSQFERDLAEAGLASDKVPSLRLAYPVDVQDEAKSDSNLADMITWASTIIRIPLKPGTFEHLHDEMVNFPGEFLLFSDKVGKLELVNLVPEHEQNDVYTRIQNEEKPYEYILSKNGETALWRVFEKSHRPSSAALKEVAENTARELLTVSWAIQISGRQDNNLKGRRGQFWQHFPTAQDSIVSGIFNAPFHLNDDRANLRESLFNKEIMRDTIPQLVSTNLPLVFNAEEPAKIVDIYPTTKGGWQGWQDDIIREATLKKLSQVQSIPTQSGELKSPAEVELPPFGISSDEPGSEVVETFYEELKHNPQQASRWVHQNALQKSRFTSLKAIYKVAKKSSPNLRQMAEALTPGKQIDGIRSALKVVVAADKTGNADIFREVQDAKVLLDGLLQKRPVKPYELTLINSLEDSGDNPARFVHPDIYHDTESARSLRHLQFKLEGGLTNLSRALQNLKKTPTDSQKVRDTWRTMANLDNEQSEIINTVQRYFPHNSMPVLMRNGSVKPVNESWLVGRLFTENESEEDRALTVDIKALGNVSQLIRLLGGKLDLDAPALKDAHDPTYHWWTETGGADYVNRLKNDDGLNIHHRKLRYGPQVLSSGLHLLVNASVETRYRATLKALEGSLRTLEPEPKDKLIGCQEFESPNLYWILNYGVVKTTYGMLEVKDLYQPFSNTITHELQPVIIDSEVRSALEKFLPRAKTLSQILKVAHANLSLEKVHQLYVTLAHETSFKPARNNYLKSLTSEGGKPKLSSEIYITYTDKATSHILTHYSNAGIIQAPDAISARTLADRWEITFADIQFSTETRAEGQIRERRLHELVPFLGNGIPGTRNIKNILVVDCTSVVEYISNNFDQVLEKRQVKTSYISNEKTIYIQRGISTLSTLTAILTATGSKLIPSEVLEKNKQLSTDAKQRELIERVNQAEDINEKLLMLLGEEKLERIMPQDVIEMIEAVTGIDVSPKQYGDILESIHGVDLLKFLRQYMPEENQPGRLAGGPKAKEWVAELGFDEAFAGERNIKLPPQEFFSGPVRLPELHDYQKSVGQEIINMISSPIFKKGFVSLPTGSGKTRVVTESVVRYCSQDGVQPQLVVWVAATNELCEQAVSSWSMVWQSFGKTNGSLAISRLWDSRRPEHAAGVDLHVVVATYQTLNKVIEGELFDWMKEANLLIIDEAHGALARSFTSILDWFGRGTRSNKLKGHLLGLSATPYRGYNEEETEHLAQRFNRNLFEPAEFKDGKAHAYLQDLGVLSRDEYDELQGIVLHRRPVSASQKQGIYTDGSPASEANSRMAELSLDLNQVVNSSERNAEIIRHIQNRYTEHPESSTILFAASVQHAIALAATLSILGIPAASVSASSSPAARSRAIAGFRDGTYKVLTNYGVLSEGFDAPKCDAVYIARPVFSPNRYLQMIGRGLRGPLNGGSEKTLIVNVRDNTANFDQKLAFDELKRPWKQK